MRQEGAAGVVSGGDGAGGAVGRVVRVDRALLPKARQWVAPGGSGADAAHLLVAAVVQLSDPGVERSVMKRNEADNGISAT